MVEEDILELKVDHSTKEGKELIRKFEKKFGDRAKIGYAKVSDFDPRESPTVTCGIKYIIWGYENIRLAFFSNDEWGRL